MHYLKTPFLQSLLKDPKKKCQSCPWHLIVPSLHSPLHKFYSFSDLVQVELECCQVEVDFKVSLVMEASFVEEANLVEKTDCDTSFQMVEVVGPSFNS